jgi:tetratricopeptide (TPR) repeat protein
MKSDARHRIKQDELRTGMEHAWTFARLHPREIKTNQAVVGGAVVFVVGFRQYSSHQAQASARAFGQAQETFEAPVLAELPEGAEKPAGTTFATAAEKYQKAAEAFDKVAADYGRTNVGLRARYYAALARLQTGDQARAEKDLQELTSGRDLLVRGLARMALAEAYRRRGDVEKAAAAYRQVADDSGSEVPRDHALMRLGTLLEEANRVPEAVSAYRRVVEEFPSGVYADDARRRTAALEPAGRG